MLALRENQWRSTQSEKSNPFLKGFNHEVLISRRIDAQDMFASDVLTTMQSANKQLDRAHTAALLDACGVDGKIPEWLPLAPFSVQAVASVGEGVSLYLNAARYADIFDSLGLVVLGRGNGRTCSATLTDSACCR